MSDKDKNGGFDDEFDWEEYDKLTSGQSNSDQPLSRRSRNGASGGTRRTGSAPPAPEPARKRKNGRRKKKKQLTEKQKKFRSRLRAFIIVLIIVIIVIVSSVCVGMYAAVAREIKDMNIKNLALNSTSFIYYNDVYGTEQELEQIQTSEKRIWVESSQIPQVMKDAIVSIEDERFFKHHGVDIKRTAGATARFALSKVGIGSASYGGSTITQQVIKNITNEKEATATRKVKEMMRAIALERELTKDEILTLYLNIAYFANGCNGVEAASNVYFAKHASELTLPEAASIAGITQFPSQFDPYVHPDSNIEKRNTVLKKMFELGYITETEYNEAASSDLIVNNAYIENGTRISSYFVDQVITDVIADLQTKKGYSADFAAQQVYNGGLKIYSTVDVNIQSILEDVYYNGYNFPYTDGVGQSAMIIMDPYTGQVKGLIGGLGQKTDVRGFNRATQAQRQPGSSIKPLSAYGPAVDLGKITEVTTIVDEEITIGNDNWKPKNSYNDFYGSMTVREALARSSNIPAVKVLDMVGLSTSYGYLQNKFHLGSLIEEDKNYSSLSLGGLTKGVSPEEMAAAYCVFVNGGKYIKPYTYTRVEDSNGQVILENEREETQAISAAAAYIMSDLLSAVVTNPHGTGRAAALDSGMPTYGKTGTTDKDFDKWFVGFTPYYVGAVWYGFDSPSSITAAGVSGNPCVEVWKTVMERVHEGLSEKEIERPTNVVEATVCAYSGKLATSGCDAVTSYFVDGTQPKSMCDSSHAYNSYRTELPTETQITATDAPEQEQPSATEAALSGEASLTEGTSGGGLSGGAGTYGGTGTSGSAGVSGSAGTSGGTGTYSGTSGYEGGESGSGGASSGDDESYGGESGGASSGGDESYDGETASGDEVSSGDGGAADGAAAGEGE